MRKLVRTIKQKLLRRLSRYFYTGMQYFYLFAARGKNWRLQEEKPIALLWGFNRWKWNHMPAYLPEFRILFVNKKGPWREIKAVLDRNENLTFVSWGYQAPPEVEAYAASRNIPLLRMEDGFIRSADLGCKHTRALSLVLDYKGLYFDATRPSELEDILNTYDFSAIPGLVEASRTLLETMKALKVSKYNMGLAGNAAAALGPQKQYRILVVGQLESDASLRYGMADDWTNLKLLEKAREEHPEAEIIYRPHPDTLHLQREDSMSGEGESAFYRIFSEPVILADLFAVVDHVYTMTSLSGMEALLHGLRVTVVGMPFYAGWGLTDDRRQCERRKRRLTLEELFYGAYVLYPRYCLNLSSPVEGCLATMTQVVAPRLASANPPKGTAVSA